jgi:23S rRNA (uracil1939-C5)-methyltransferase
VVHLNPTGPLVLAGSEIIFFEILDRTFQVSPASFFQVNTPMTGTMVSHILEFLESSNLLSAQTIMVDAYCGVGLFSAFLAPRVGQLIGIENNPSSCEDFIMNLDEFDNVSLYEGSVEIVLPNLNIQPDIVLVDPSRSGLNRRALDGLENLSPEFIIYVSCDPSTLARDAKRLISAGYQLKQVTPFDLFPQTYHIESISIWTR